MQRIPKEVIPQKVNNPTSLEDIGWNSCCDQMEKTLFYYEIQQLLEADKEGKLAHDFTQGVTG